MVEQQLLRDYLAGTAREDEMFDTAGEVGPAYRDLSAALQRWSLEEYELRQDRADLALLSAGITFNVYSDEEGTERIFPFSLIPRIIEAGEWQQVNAGAAAADAGAESLPRGPLWGAAHPQGEGRARGGGAELARLPARDGRLPAATGGLRTHRRLRPGAQRRGRVRGAGRQPAHALRGLVCAREPRGDAAGGARSVPAGRGAVGGRLSKPAAGDVTVGGARNEQRPRRARCCSRRASTTPPTSSTRS